MLFIHPALMFATCLLAIYNFESGLVRFGLIPGQFNWKAHVLVGKIVMILWLIGYTAGITMVTLTWNRPFISQNHWKVATIMLPLIIFGLISGIMMDKYKKHYKLLPVVHGISNLALVLLGILQIYLGAKVLKLLVLI